MNATIEQIIELFPKVRRTVGGRPTEIRKHANTVEFRIYTAEDEPEEDEYDDREWNLNCYSEDFLRDLQRMLRDEGNEAEISYYWCETRDLRYEGVYLSACIQVN